ncbi:MAG TPA: ADOP family duplicated permease, partial [Gemmatimonadaceae bacterium]
MLASFAADLRFALRVLRKNPLVTVVAVLCIALGSGAVTAIYSVMNALVLQPLSGAADATQLLRIERKAPHENDGTSASYPLYEYLAARSRSLSGLAAWSKGSFTIGRSSSAGTTVYGNFVTPNFFTVLGVRPLLGRLPATEEPSPVIVVSEGFWRTALGGDSAEIGHDVLVNGRHFTLVGVAPAAFRGVDDPIKTDAWTPLSTRRLLDPAAAPLPTPSELWLRLAGRLAPHATAATSHRELSALTAAFHAEGAEPDWLAKYTDLRTSALTGLPPDASKPLAGFLGVLLGAAALVLVIASINVGAILSARAIARRREMAVRTALGAATSRLVRQLLTEILLLFALGALAGIGIASVATKALERMPIPSEIAFAPVLSPDARVFAFALAISLATGLLVGTASARRATHVDIAKQLRDGAAAATARRSWLGDALVVGQLAASLVLLVGVGLFLRALEQASRIDPGFEATHVAAVALDPAAWGYDEARARVFFRDLRDRVEHLPGVATTGYVTVLPLTLRGNVDEMQVDPGADAKVPLHFLQVDAGYFSTLRMPLVLGRGIARTDDQHAPSVAVVNETFVHRFMTSGSVLGRAIRYRDARVSIIGVVRDAKLESLDERVPPRVFFPIDQQWESKRALLVRSTGDSRALAASIQRAVRNLDGTAPRPTVVPLETAMSIGVMPQRIAASVTGALGLVGMILATVGLYGIVAYSTTRRAHEIGIRLALGATASDVLRMVLRGGMSLTMVGVAVGVVVAAGASRVVASLLYGVSSIDPVAYGA